MCFVDADCTLSLVPRGVGATTATTAATARQEHVWPLPLLRRYGRKGDAFYFEAGRRCASGPGTLCLLTSMGEAIFTTVERELATYRERAEGQERAEARAIEAMQEKRRAEEMQAETERLAAIARYVDDHITSHPHSSPLSISTLTLSHQSLLYCT